MSTPACSAARSPQLADERISTAGAAFKAATAWMIADGIRCLIVLRAHLLSAGGWEHLIEAGRCAGVRLVLVRHGPDSRPELGQLLMAVRPRTRGSLNSGFSFPRSSFTAGTL
jgi:hypothetical protein